MVLRILVEGRDEREVHFPSDDVRNGGWISIYGRLARISSHSSRQTKKNWSNNAVVIGDLTLKMMACTDTIKSEGRWEKSYTSVLIENDGF